MTSMEESTVVDLPAGFRFHPTDEEIITYYLREKVLNSNFSAAAIGEADLNKCEPWDLPKRAKMGEKEFYLFCQRDRKYPTGMRTNRATESGYWKATGKDKEIFKDKTCLVGMKKTLVFYIGRAPKGEKTNWVMHEYRLEGRSSYYNLPKSARDEWVVCRVFHKNTGQMIIKKPVDDLLRMNSFESIDRFLDFSSLPPLMDPNNFSGQPGPSYSANESMNLYQAAAPSNQTLVGSRIPIQNPNDQYSPVALIPNPVMQTLAPRNPNGAFNVGDEEKMIKMEQQNISSNHHSIVTMSQETGLSSDVNATPEISSGIISKHEMMTGTSNICYEDLADLEIYLDYGYD